MAKAQAYDQPSYNTLNADAWKTHVVPALKAIDGLMAQVPGASEESKAKVSAMRAMAKVPKLKNSPEYRDLESEVGNVDETEFLRKSLILARACVKRIGQPEGVKRAKGENGDDEDEDEEEGEEAE